MKLLIDLFPIILFFVAYKLYGIYLATASAILASLAQVIWLRWRHGRFETLPLVTLGLIVVFGGLTLALRDPIFVMWKPTLVNWLFAAAFLGGSLIGRRPLVERMMGQTITVPAAVWQRLNWAWVLFFALLGAINLFVVYIASGFYGAEQALITATAITEIDLADCASQFTGEVLGLCEQAQASEETWVNFKLFGMMGLTILFVIGQAFYLARHIQDEAAGHAETEMRRAEPHAEPTKQAPQRDASRSPAVPTKPQPSVIPGDTR